MNKRFKRCIPLLLLSLLLCGCGSNPVPAGSAAPAAPATPTVSDGAAEPPAAAPTAAAQAEQPAPPPAPGNAADAYEAAVQALLEEYRILRITEPGEFRQEEHPEVPWSSLSVYLYDRYDDLGLYCGRYDFDGNGVPELVIATGDGAYYYPIGVYAFDGAALRYLGKEQPLGELASLSLGEDGSFIVSTSDGGLNGVALVYRIAADGFSTEILDWYKYDCLDDGSVRITPFVGSMSAERFDKQQLWRPFTTPIDYEQIF